FGSQTCTSAPGDVTVTRADLSTDLLVGDTASFTPPSSYYATNIDGEMGLDHETLRLRPPSTISGFAGRGLYGNFVLLFPKAMCPDDEIVKIKDVLLRFDITEITHAAPL